LIDLGTAQIWLCTFARLTLSPDLGRYLLQSVTFGSFRFLMSRRHDPNLRDRLSESAQAKSALLAKFKQTLSPDNPALIEQRKKREAIAAARDERHREREVLRQQQEREREQQRILAEQAAAEAARVAAEKEAREAAEAAEREAALKAEQKAERDARYAARKAAKKQRRKG
jgi:hypothetical protein